MIVIDKIAIKEKANCMGTFAVHGEAEAGIAFTLLQSLAIEHPAGGDSAGLAVGAEAEYFQLVSGDLKMRAGCKFRCEGVDRAAVELQHPAAVGANQVVIVSRCRADELVTAILPMQATQIAKLHERVTGTENGGTPDTGNPSEPVVHLVSGEACWCRENGIDDRNARLGDAIPFGMKQRKNRVPVNRGVCRGNAHRLGSSIRVRKSLISNCIIKPPQARGQGRAISDCRRFAPIAANQVGDRRVSIASSRRSACVTVSAAPMCGASTPNLVRSACSLVLNQKRS